MRARLSTASVAVSVVATTLVAGACRKSSDDERATREAEQRAAQTTITSGELTTGEETNDEALREQAEAITAARNEQLEYRGKLQASLDRLDGKRREAKKRGPAHVKVIDARRELLKHDLDALDRTTDAEWAALKAKIDRDVKEAGSGAAEGDGK